jgi:UDPglucose 6-dehydrogenase
MNSLKIGFIGQGFVGKALADNFAERGFETIRYSLESEYVGNKERVKDADVVFIAVPTPTLPEGFDFSILRNEIKLVGGGKIAVIKSTILPGTTELLQKENPEITIFHSPEFLVAKTAENDTKNPERNLIGIPEDSGENRKNAELVLSLLPKAPFEKVLLSKETELIKYIGNNFLYTKVIFMNLMYDLAERVGADWNNISEAVSKDSRIGTSHMQPVHTSERSDGRGAGGHCFPKDFEALLRMHAEVVKDDTGNKVLQAIRNKNNELLMQSNKDLDILEAIYGKGIIEPPSNGR